MVVQISDRLGAKSLDRSDATGDSRSVGRSIGSVWGLKSNKVVLTGDLIRDFWTEQTGPVDIRHDMLHTTNTPLCTKAGNSAR